MDPPKHEMAFFPNMTTSLPSESAEFRRVLWTGLYSQLVLMTVPVDGEIGDEVCQDYTRRGKLDSAHLSLVSFRPSANP
jgi:mannose-6-phosphate isomerase-like protein (cupin superfamily)